ncbi:MAG: hypothetical protein LAO55_01495 [Acidobacteriia bacterium]|nr:hypothetical protein [Terriglobia bacterium]
MRLCTDWSKRKLWLALVLVASAAWASGQDLAAEAWRLESSGDAEQALRRLQQAATGAPNDPSTLRAYAEFLAAHRDPAAREAYARLGQLLQRTNAPAAQRAAVAERLAVLDLLAGDREASARHLQDYSAQGGKELALPPARILAPPNYIEIPGPLRSFARMAAMTPEVNPNDLLPALARNIITNGYRATTANEALEQTEYLKLVIRYLSQARELEKLAGSDKTLRIDMCESPATADLLRVIGFRMRGGCGSDLVLETVNASRAFLTTDSGFPLAELELALRTNRPFTLDYRPTRVPILYAVDYWQPVAKDKAQDKNQGEFIDYLLGDPSLCRLYVALSKLDLETAEQLRQAIPSARLKIYAHVLDFFGGMFQIRGGKAVVPGGARSEKEWADLNGGVTPDKGAAFIERMITRDDGWLASYFDSLARIEGPVKDYLTDPERLKRFYAAIKGKVTSPGPARPVFRSNTDMLLLTTRLRLDTDGKPHLPGGLEIWKRLFAEHPEGKYDAKLTRAAPQWKDADDVLEALFGLCRKAAENEPLKIFMALTDIDRRRSKPLEPATMDRLARNYRTLSAQYPLFAEVPTLTDSTVSAYLETTRSINAIRNQGLRADAAGTAQALIGLWQIFVRQQSVPRAAADATLASLLEPFAQIRTDRDVFDAGRAGIRNLLQAAKSPAGISPQDRMLDLLAGGVPEGVSDTHQHMVEDLIRIFEAQRLVPLTTIFDLADNLDSVGKGQPLNTALTGRLATRISEIQLPRNSLSSPERSTLSFGYWTEQHIEDQRKLNLRAAIDKAAKDPQKLSDLRGELSGFLRDTLVGFNYMYYAPPGAQVLRTNPLFVRGHDFIGIQGANQTWGFTYVPGSGWPSNAGGRLAGSLASLPYALAEAEENFLIPSHEQALIWGDLVPQIMLTAIVPRWGNVSPVQTHWVGIHMAYGESLLGRSALNADRRRQVIATLEPYLAPGRLRKIDDLLQSGEPRIALENVLPSEMYLLARAMAGQDRESPLAGEIRRMAAEAPAQLSPEAISEAFGTPKPTLANTYGLELLNLRTFPTLMGYSSRILAESWESNLLYYGALADEIHAQPEQMNLLVPSWTQQTVENIFATHLEDWPALLRSLRVVGDDVREKARRQTQASNSEVIAR